ncbi:alpha-galactosidase [Haladaptatus sp. DFWS20]|uniref:alpha-galactosidase n=1 Tax=Haladaptatus sp. DFWS20 TaxID=3403467 RepID=UPI003EB9D2F6
MTLRVTGGQTTVEYRPDEHRLVVKHGSETLLDGSIKLDVGAETLPASSNATTTSVRTTAHATHDDGWETTVELDASDGHVDVRVSFRTPHDRKVALGDLRPLADATAPTHGADARRYRHGYQSWTPTATLPVGERFPSEENEPQMCDLTAPQGASHGVMALLNDDGALTMGFLDHSRFVSRFDVAHDENGIRRAEAVCPGDATTVPGGEELSLPTLRIDATRSLHDALAAIAATTAERMGARVPDDAPTGWCSWYHYFTDVSAADIRETLDDLAEWDVPLDIVQLDDGYQTAFGDWRTLDEGFDDIGELVTAVRAADYTPGLWLAPFYVQSNSSLAADHPDWLVTRDGDPVDAGPRHGPMYALDTTHPEAERWLRETFETIVSEWRFEYCKLDFLYAAALPGDRHEDVTRAEAYRRGLTAIRETVGDDVFLLGCGALQGQSVGLVDAMRVGPDTAPHWRAAPASQPAHENAIRNVLNRQWAHRRLWMNDPDCQLVRETTDLTLAERRSFATLVALLGGSNVVSDRVADIEPVGRELVERSLPPMETGRVRGVGEQELPTRLVGERRVDGALAVAAFNWSDTTQSVRIDPAEHSLTDAHVWDAFESEYRGTGPFERSVPPHGCLLVHMAPARGRPRLLGARHLGNLCGHVTAVDWDEAGQLAVTLTASQAQSVVVTTPGGWSRDGGAVTDCRLEPGRTTLTFEES